MSFIAPFCHEEITSAVHGAAEGRQKGKMAYYSVRFFSPKKDAFPCLDLAAGPPAAHRLLFCLPTLFSSISISVQESARKCRGRNRFGRSEVCRSLSSTLGDAEQLKTCDLPRESLNDCCNGHKVQHLISNKVDLDSERLGQVTLAAPPCSVYLR